MSVLLQALERPEVNKLPKAVQNKLERFITDLRTKHERFKADCEQQYFDVEKRLTDSQDQAVSHARVYTALQYENRQLVEELNKLKGLDEESGEKPGETQSKAKYEIEAERRELARLLEKRNQEVDNLTDDVKQLNDKLLESNTAKVALQLQLDEIQSSEVSIQHREKRVKQEKELLQNQNTWLSSELKLKTEELLSETRDKDRLVLDLRCSLEAGRDELTRVQSQVTTLRRSSEAQQKRAEDLMTKLKEAKDQQTTMEEKYLNELNANIKLSNLYKGAAADAETRNEELNRAVEELHKVVKESGEANQSLERKLSDLEESKGRQEAELKEKINKMEKELENAMQHATDTHRSAPVLTEEELESMCPTAAAVAKIVKPGMKFMELYNAFVASQDDLQQERLEARRLARVLDQIVQEVESKAPVLRRQRDEYQSLQHSMSCLCTRLDLAREEIHGLQKESDEANKRCSSLESDKQRIERQLEDTAQQVRVLLVEVEEARGNPVVREDVSSTAISSSSEVIMDPRQVAFRNVEELQRQNQSLLGRLRELGEQREREQNEAHAARVCLLEQALDKARAELEMLKEQRNQQKQLADSNARQRDMYRILLTQSTGFNLPPGPAQDPPSTPAATRSAPLRPAADSTQTTQAKAALKQVSDAFSTYKREKAENDRMLSETVDRLTQQLTDARSLNARLTSQTRLSSTRYDMLQENVGGYRREIAALQEKSHKMAATAQNQEHIIHTITHDLRAANENLATAEVRVENLRKERDLLRAVEGRLTQEKEAVMTEQRNQNLLMTNLKSIQVAMERSEAEGLQRQGAQRRRLEEELHSLKDRLLQEAEQRHALGRSMDAQLLEAKKQLEAQNALHQKTRELLRVSEQQVAHSPAPTQASTNPRAPFRSSPRAPALGQVSQLERELAEARGGVVQAEEQSSDLRERLKNATANVEQYRTVVLSLEESLNQEKQARAPVEAGLREAQEVHRQLETKLLEAERDKHNLQEEGRRAVDAVEKQVAALRRSLQSVQSELQDAGDRATAAVAQQQKAMQDSLQQARLASEAQEKYERELMLHATDVEALQAAKQSSQQEALARRQLEENSHNTSAALEEQHNTWTQLEKTLKEELSQQQRRGEELQRQNLLLHQQMEALGAKMAAAVQQQQTAREGALNLSFSEEGKTTEQILQILRFVRREKEIAEARLEVAEVETLRYKQQGEHQDRDIRELQDALNTERDRLQLTLGTLAQQEERMKTVEDTAALVDANKTLRDTTDRLEQELQQAQAKGRRLEASLPPLQASLAELTQRNTALHTHNKLLEDDNKRWKTRTQQLVVQQKESEVEEGRRQQAEREAQARRLQALADEAARLKAELARSSASVSSSQSQLASLRETATKLTSEREAVKKELEARNLEMLEKNKTITQVKKIGRRYKTQYEELKAQHDKLVAESSSQPGQDQQAEQNQKEVQLQQAQRDLAQARQDTDTARTDLQQARSEQQQAKTEADKTRQELQQARQETDRVKTEVQQAKTEADRARQDLQQAQREVQQARQTFAQENQNLKTSLSQAENRAKDLEGQLDNTQKMLADREAEVGQLTLQPSETQPQTQAGEELSALRQELQERRSQEEFLRQQMADKEEKTKKAFMGAKQKINQLNSVKEQLSKEKEDLQQACEEMEVRMNALKSQYEGRLQRQERDLRDLREQHTHTHTHTEQRDDSQEQSNTKAQEQQRAAEQRQISLKSSPAADRGSASSSSASSSDPPTANIRPTTSVSSGPPSKACPAPSGPPSKACPAPSSKATPRASIRPMVTPATVSMPTPTATVMPTTQVESQEEGGSISVFASGSVRSTSPSIPPTSLPQPISSQTTAFVQPTQQQQATPPAEPASQEEWPSTSSAVIGSVVVSGPGGPPGPKRVREEQPEAGPESLDTPLEEPEQPPVNKRLRFIHRMGLEEDIDEGTDGELEGGENQDTPDNSQELPEEGFPVLAEVEEEDEEGGVSQSVPSDPVTLQVDPQDSAEAPHHDVIVIDTDSSESREEEEEEEEAEKEKEEEEEEEEEEDRDRGIVEERNEGSRDTHQAYEEEEEEEEEETETGTETSEPASQDDQSMGGATDSAHRMADSQSGEGSSTTESFPLADTPRELRLHPASSSPSLPPSLDPRHAPLRLPQSPRRPPHPLPPRLYIQPPAPELGPPPHRQTGPPRRQSVGRGPQLTPGIGSMQHFFDEDDRMVPSTPTLVVPHRTDGFAEAIHSPQVAGVPRFRFGPPEDMMQQASSSHSDLGQLASQGGLGMYESPLFLAAHEEESGGRSVPTTPLQVAAPVSVFAESHPSDVSDMASQSVPMVTTSTAGLAVPGDDGDEVFMEGESEGSSGEASLESQGDQQPDDGSLPSTSQEPTSSSTDTSSSVQAKPSGRPPPPRTAAPPRGLGTARTLLRRGVAFTRAGRGPYGRGNIR